MHKTPDETIQDTCYHKHDVDKLQTDKTSQYTHGVVVQKYP